MRASYPLLSLAMAAWLGCSWLACPVSAQQSTTRSAVAREQQRATTAALVGEWVPEVAKDEFALHIGSDGHFVLGEERGNCIVDGKTLRLSSQGTEAIHQFQQFSPQ